MAANDESSIHPAVKDFASDLRAGTLSRREFLRLATLLGLSVAAAQTLAGCGAAAPAPSAVVPTAGGGAAAGAIKRGGRLTVGTNVQAIDHPARLAWVHSANQVRQIAEYLTETGPDNITRPWLLDRWEADQDVKTWTLHLRQGVKFNNGDELTADDVVFTFNQWLDPATKSSMQSLLSYLDSSGIEKVDPYTLRLHLKEPQIGLPEHLFHYPGVILHRGFEGDFIKKPVGTGPFTLEEFTVGERAHLKRRTDYWRMGEDGQALPYLDELMYVQMAENDRALAIQNGQIDSIMQVRPTDWMALKSLPMVNVYSVRTAQTLVVRMRTDVEPWSDPRVRQALKLCQDRQKMLDLAFFGEGDLALDAHVAPVHPAYCERPIPKYDPQQARALLAEAGHPDGLKVTLTIKTDDGEEDLARVLKSLAAPGGFEITINIVKPEEYWNQWTEVDFGITIWYHRPLDTMTLALAYTVDGEQKPVAWNETRWVDDEFNQLLRTAERTLDVAARREIMCQLEDIMQSRGPIGISFWRKNWNITRTEFKNVRAHPTGYDLFYDVWKDA